MQTTFNLVLKINPHFGDVETLDVVKEALVDAAQGVFAQAAMVAGSRPPSMHITYHNSKEGVVEVQVFTEEEA